MIPEIYEVSLYLCKGCKDKTSKGITNDIFIIYTPEGRCCQHLSELDIKWGDKKNNKKDNTS